MYNTTYRNGKLEKYTFDESEIDYLFASKNDNSVDKLLTSIFGKDWYTDEFETFKSKFEENINSIMELIKEKEEELQKAEQELNQKIAQLVLRIPPAFWSAIR